MKDKNDLNQRLNDAGERFINAGVNFIDGLSKKIDDKAASFYDSEDSDIERNNVLEESPNVIMKCPSCGASFEHDPEKDIYKCEYCGETIYRNGTINKKNKSYDEDKSSKKRSILYMVLPFVGIIALAIVLTIHDAVIDGGSKTDKIAAIHASDDYAGEDPTAVREELESLGFTNIQMIAQKPDLFDIFDLNEVESVTVNGSLMTMNAKYKKDAPIQIRYYSFDILGNESTETDSEEVLTPSPTPIVDQSETHTSKAVPQDIPDTASPSSAAQNQEETEKSIDSAENTETQEAALEKKNPIFITTTKVKIRIEPNTECDVVDIVDADTEIECIDTQSDGWSRINYNGKTAYIKSEYLSKKEDSAEEKQKSTDTTPITWCLNTTANHFISSYNRMYPDEQIGKDDIFVNSYTASYIRLSDEVFIDIGESDNETTYQCFGFTKFSEENRSTFFEYANRLKKLTLGRFSLKKCTSDYPASEMYDNGVMVTSYDEYKSPKETHGKEYIMHLYVYPKQNY